MENNNSKLKILFVGGLDATANEEILYSAFIPFGVIKEVHIPKDFQKNVHRGFGFVEYEDAEDAADAIENMDGAEICGKFIKVHVAKPTSKIQHGKSAWSAEEWIESNLEENETNEDTVLQE